jgi:hypothetical protein
LSDVNIPPVENYISSTDCSVVSYLYYKLDVINSLTCK